MCRFHQLCLGSPLRSEMEAQNHKEKKKNNNSETPKCTSKGEFFASNTAPIVFLGVHPIAFNLVN